MQKQSRFPFLGIKYSFLFLVAAALVACSSSSDSDDPDIPLPSLSDLKADVAQNYAAIVQANYEDSLSILDDLQQSINEFVADPDEAKFKAAKAVWLNSRLPYGQTEAYRFYNGPIDNPEDGPEGLINSWPLDEVYIDYVEDSSGFRIETGLIFDRENLPTIDTQSIVNLNQPTDEAEVSVGFHAIEFLLWGQDKNENPEDAGMRPYTDYSPDRGDIGINQRRADYLKYVTERLISDLKGVEVQWQEGDANNYRAEFVATPETAIKNILIGLGTLANGELASERIEVALIAKNQEHEHSCFSDNTHQDILMNIKGIENVMRGTYTDSNGDVVVSGSGILVLIAFQNPELAGRIETELNKALTLANQMVALAEGSPKVPFDQQIMGDDSNPNRLLLNELVDALRTFEISLTTAAAELGYPDISFALE